MKLICAERKFQSPSPDVIYVSEGNDSGDEDQSKPKDADWVGIEGIVSGVLV